jgi:hypothetical protein
MFFLTVEPSCKSLDIYRYMQRTNTKACVLLCFWGGIENRGTFSIKKPTSHPVVRPRWPLLFFTSFECLEKTKGYAGKELNNLRLMACSS